MIVNPNGNNKKVLNLNNNVSQNLQLNKSTEESEVAKDLKDVNWNGTGINESKDLVSDFFANIDSPERDASNSGKSDSGTIRDAGLAAEMTEFKKGNIIQALGTTTAEENQPINPLAVFDILKEESEQTDSGQIVVQHNINTGNRILNPDSASGKLEKLGSGIKIDHKADDDSGLAISQKMKDALNSGENNGNTIRDSEIAAEMTNYTNSAILNQAASNMQNQGVNQSDAPSAEREAEQQQSGGMVVQHNINSDALDKKLEKLGSGIKIDHKADDASGLAISQKMKDALNKTSYTGTVTTQDFYDFCAWLNRLDEDGKKWYELIDFNTDNNITQKEFRDFIHRNLSTSSKKIDEGVIEKFFEMMDILRFTGKNENGMQNKNLLDSGEITKLIEMVSRNAAKGDGSGLLAKFGITINTETDSKAEDKLRDQQAAADMVNYSNKDILASAGAALGENPATVNTDVFGIRIAGTSDIPKNIDGVPDEIKNRLDYAANNLPVGSNNETQEPIRDVDTDDYMKSISNNSILTAADKKLTAKNKLKDGSDFRKALSAAMDNDEYTRNSTKLLIENNLNNTSSVYYEKACNILISSTDDSKAIKEILNLFVPSFRTRRS